MAPKSLGFRAVKSSTRMGAGKSFTAALPSPFQGKVACAASLEARVRPRFRQSGSTERSLNQN